MPYKRGAVVLVLFPDANLRTAKRRPALVIQSNDLNGGLGQTIVAMITSNMKRAGHPSRVTLLLNSTEGKESRILMDSVVMTDNLATIRESEIDRELGRLNNMSGINNALRLTLGLHGK
jgi:mRNA interferase MazF